MRDTEGKGVRKGEGEGGKGREVTSGRTYVKG